MVTSNRLKAYGALAGSFLLGALAAGAGYHAYTERRLDAAFGHDREAFETRRVRAMGRELDLSEEQETRLLELFRKHAPERQRILREQMETCGAPMEAHRERIDAEINAILDAEQQKKFLMMRAEHRRRFLGAEPSARPR
jgi:Spy/CpxP family protein refolding chaperone